MNLSRIPADGGDNFAQHLSQVTVTDRHMYAAQKHIWIEGSINILGESLDEAKDELVSSKRGGNKKNTMKRMKLKKVAVQKHVRIRTNKCS